MIEGKQCLLRMNKIVPKDARPVNYFELLNVFHGGKESWRIG